MLKTNNSPHSDVVPQITVFFYGSLFRSEASSGNQSQWTGQLGTAFVTCSSSLCTFNNLNYHNNPITTDIFHKAELTKALTVQSVPKDNEHHEQ